jgi:hypothetical protein
MNDSDMAAPENCEALLNRSKQLIEQARQLLARRDTVIAEALALPLPPNPSPSLIAEHAAIKQHVLATSDAMWKSLNADRKPAESSDSAAELGRTAAPVRTPKLRNFA